MNSYWKRSQLRLLFWPLKEPENKSPSPQPTKKKVSSRYLSWKSRLNPLSSKQFRKHFSSRSSEMSKNSKSSTSVYNPWAKSWKKSEKRMHKAEIHYALICQMTSILAAQATKLYLQSDWKRANTWLHFRSCSKPRTNGFTFTWTKEKQSWVIRDFMSQPQASGCLSQSE